MSVEQVVSLGDIKRLYGNNPDGRFNFKQLWVTASPFNSDVVTCGEKRSVYVESPSRSGTATFMCSFSTDPCPRLFQRDFVQLGHVYDVHGAYISKNPCEESRCPYQIVLDSRSSIIEVCI